MRVGISYKNTVKYSYVCGCNVTKCGKVQGVWILLQVTVVLFEARKVAGSAMYKHIESSYNCPFKQRTFDWGLLYVVSPASHLYIKCVESWKVEKCVRIQIYCMSCCFYRGREWKRLTTGLVHPQRTLQWYLWTDTWRNTSLLSLWNPTLKETLSTWPWERQMWWTPSPSLPGLSGSMTHK